MMTARANLFRTLTALAAAAVAVGLLVLVGATKPAEAEPTAKIRTYVVVLDGVFPHSLNPEEMPHTCALVSSCGDSQRAATQSTIYEAARAVMPASTGSNHISMVTGAYPARHGVTDNFYWDRRALEPDSDDFSLLIDNPAMVTVPTLFDVLEERERFDTGLSVGWEFLRRTLDCTRTEEGKCGESAENPEKENKLHRQPRWWRGAIPDSDWPGWRQNPGGAPIPAAEDDCLADPVTETGFAPDDCVMSKALDFIDQGDPDFTLINLGGHDLAAHAVGMNTEASRKAVTESDRQIGRLVDCIEGNLECPNGSGDKWAHSVLFVVSDHSFSHAHDQGHIIDIADISRKDEVVWRLVQEAGYDSVDDAIHVVGNAGTTHVYLDDVKVGDSRLTDLQERILARLRGLLTQHPGISEAWYRLDNSHDPGNDLATRRPAWGLHGNQRAGELVVTALASAPTFDPLDPGNAEKSRGGNAFEVTSGSGYSFGTPQPAPLSARPADTHGHPGTRHILFVVAGGLQSCVSNQVAALDKRIPTARLEGDDTHQLTKQAENVDIGPTILWTLGLDPSLLKGGGQGRVLREAFSCQPPAP
jgi:predicted AlkP superfamily pyrophosphatase or phosphodiesterase